MKYDDTPHVAREFFITVENLEALLKLAEKDNRGVNHILNIAIARYVESRAL